MDLGSLAKKIYFYLFQAPGRLISINYALVWCFPPSRSVLFLFSGTEIPPGREMPSDASFFFCDAAPARFSPSVFFFFFLSSCLINYQTKRSTKWWSGVLARFLELWKKKKKLTRGLKSPAGRHWVKALTHPEVWVDSKWKNILMTEEKTLPVLI